MTRLFLEDGESVPVTAVSVCGNFLADIKTTSRDGYNAFVVSKVNKSNNVNKSKSEFYKKISSDMNCILTPHISGVTTESNIRVSDFIVKKTTEFFNQ